MTTRMDHTHCSWHSRTPEGRRYCRARRIADLRACQQAYMSMEMGGTEQGEYEAMVYMFATTFGMNLPEAYDLVERSEIV